MNAGRKSMDIVDLCAERGHVHMVGIGGIGMAGVARLLASRGLTVSGCDSGAGRTAEWLAKHDIDVRSSHDPSHIDDTVDWVIRTPAVRSDAPEILEAEKRGIPVILRGQVLPELITGRSSIAVSGTHGKTTTSTFTAQILNALKVPMAWCIGGEPPGLDGVAGDEGGIIVVEADESDGTVAGYRPEIGVITNIEFDHMEHFDSEESFKECFRIFARNTGLCLVYCADDSVAEVVAESAVRSISYGVSEGADYRISDIAESGEGMKFSLALPCGERKSISIGMKGRHNILNAVAAMAAVAESGVAFELIESVAGVLALPARRFDVISSDNDIRVVSDYAHHPTEIAAAVAMAMQYKPDNLYVIFQPHRYTRTLALGDDFPLAFAGVDRMLLLPVYAASEERLSGGTSADLYRKFRRCAGGDDLIPLPLLADSIEGAAEYFSRILSPGDMLLVVGAGDVEKAAMLCRDSSLMDEHASAIRLLCPSSSVEADGAAGRRTTFGAGGNADLLMDAGNEDDLAAALSYASEKGIPVHIAGGGSNTLVGDLGFRGLVIYLSGDQFFRVEVGDEEVIAGASASVSVLLDSLNSLGINRLNFMESIPGRLGGALSMNAGAWGNSICEHVSWIRCLNRDGSICTLAGNELIYEYRCCGTLSGLTVLSAGFRLDAKMESASKVLSRPEIAERRSWMKGLRSAGSVFKNPPGDYAGRLIEDAGLKGYYVGGARISEKHANVITVERGASASDIKALIDIAADRVRDAAGVDLEREIRILGE